MSAAGVLECTATYQVGGPGSTPRAALQSLKVTPIPFGAAKAIMERHHYLHSLPGGTQLSFGIFLRSRIMGAITIGCGPAQAHRLVEGAALKDCGALTRLWLSDELPSNSESRVIGVVLRALRKNTGLKFLISYADPAQGHLGTIYQATNWLYIGMSSPMHLYDLGDGVERHSRSFSHAFGSHSMKHFARHGVHVKIVKQSAKHRYIYFLDKDFRDRLKVAVLPYPERGNP